MKECERGSHLGEGEGQELGQDFLRGASVRTGRANRRSEVPASSQGSGWARLGQAPGWGVAPLAPDEARSEGPPQEQARPRSCPPPRAPAGGPSPPRSRRRGRRRPRGRALSQDHGAAAERALQEGHHLGPLHRFEQCHVCHPHQPPALARQPQRRRPLRPRREAPRPGLGQEAAAHQVGYALGRDARQQRQRRKRVQRRRGLSGIGRPLGRTRRAGL